MNHPAHQPERSLWLAVIGAHVEDMFSGRMAIAEPARYWLMGNSKDLNLVCDMAGVSVDFLHRKLNEWLDNKSIRPRAKFNKSLWRDDTLHPERNRKRYVRNRIHNVRTHEDRIS